MPETSPRSQTASGRARLLESALAVFAERGYDAASVAEIVARAGLAKSVLYHHFGSKSGLYAGILDAETDRLLATVRAALPSDPGAPRLRAGLDAYLEFLEDHRDVWELFVRDPPLDADARTAHERNRRKRSRALAKLINPAPSDAKGKAAYVDLLITAARTFTTWWHEHPEVPRDRVLDAITAFADVAAKHLLTD